MRITVVGCWSPYPPPGGACSAYLVQSDAASLLVDCGHGAMAQLYAYLKPEKLNGVVITHSHPDHYNDLPALRHYWRSRRYLGQDLPALPVWFPPGDKEIARWQQVPELTVQMAQGQTQVGDLTIAFIEGNHTLPTVMVRVAQGDKALFYTGDTAYSVPGVEASRDCDLLVAECTLPPQEAHLAPGLGHLTWEECGRWAAEAACPHLLATHFWPEYDRGEMAEAIKRKFAGDLSMAYPGLVVEV